MRIQYSSGYFIFLVLKPMKSVLLYLINYDSSCNTLIYLRWYGCEALSRT